MAQGISGGAAVVEVLRQAKVDHVFGLLGGSMLELYDAMQGRSDIAYIGARDERAAAHMADAYARVTGGPGVVLGAQAGPGVANLVTGIAEAHLAYSPLVAIAGAITRGDLGKDTFQEIDQTGLFAPICKRSIMVPVAERLPEMLREAMHLAMSGRRGPVVLHVPRDLFAAEIAPPPQCPLQAAGAAVPAAQDIDAILDMLAGAERPVIFAGGGFKWAGGSQALAALADGLGIPVVTSTGHADVLPTDHPLHAGQAGPRGNRVASGLTHDADLLLAIGNRLAFNSTFYSHDYVTQDGKIIQIDVEASTIGRYFPVALGIQADAKASAEAILLAARARGLSDGGWADWRRQFEDARTQLQSERAAEAALENRPLSPLRVLGEIRESLPRDAIVTLDTGAMCLQAADRLAHHLCPGLITPLDFGLVGFGYAAALGAQAAAPNRPVVSVMGDGGFGMTLSEITTAVQQNLPVVAVVLDNGAWGAEKAYQRDFFGARYLGADLVNPPYDQVARLCGAEGYAVTEPGETAAALTAALGADRPAVIHVKVDPLAFNSLRKDLFKPAR